MSALILDAGAFVAIDRGDRAMQVKVQTALRLGVSPPFCWKKSLAREMNYLFTVLQHFGVE